MFFTFRFEIRSLQHYKPKSEEKKVTKNKIRKRKGDVFDFNKNFLF